MIVGLGLDVCDIARVRRSLERYGAAFMDKVLRSEERAYCERHRDPAVPFAGRFAVKEACVKALGGPEGLRWHDMEVMPAANGPPGLRFHRVGADLVVARAIDQVHVSLTHDGGMAAAVVILERKP